VVTSVLDVDRLTLAMRMAGVRAEPEFGFLEQAADTVAREYDRLAFADRLTAALDQIEAEIEADDRGVLNARSVLQLVRAALAEAQR
jgi:hypothetical protein